MYVTIYTRTYITLHLVLLPGPDDLVFDVSLLSSDVHTYELTGRDQFGATATATSQIVIRKFLNFFIV